MVSSNNGGALKTNGQSSGQLHAIVNEDAFTKNGNINQQQAETVVNTANLSPEQIKSMLAIVMDNMSSKNRIAVYDEVLGKDSDHKALYALVRDDLVKDSNSYVRHKDTLLNAMAENFAQDPSKLTNINSFVDSLKKLDEQQRVDEGAATKVENKWVGSAKKVGQAIGQYALVMVIDQIAGTSLAKSLITADIASHVTGLDRNDVLKSMLGLGALGAVFGKGVGGAESAVGKA